MSLLSWLWSGTGTAATPGNGTDAGPGIFFFLNSGAGTPSGITAGAGFVSGRATVTAVSNAIGTPGAVGAASGTSTATAIGRSTAASRGSATGQGTVTGAPRSTSVNEGKLDYLHLEFALPGIAFAPAGFDADAFGGSGWASMLSDALASDPIVLDYGVQGNGPDDRVGSTGTLSFTLNNASNNQAGIASYYSPLHPNHRAGHAMNVPVRLVFGINGQAYHKFLGRLAESSPEPGRHGSYRVPCVAVDLMDDWAANDVPVVLPILQGYYAAQLVDHLLTTLQSTAPDLAPATRTMETSIDTLPFGFHDPSRRKIREIIIDAVMSDFGFASFRGGPESAGNFAFFNRHSSSTLEISASLINQFSVDSGFQATQSRDSLASSIEVFVHPTAADEIDVDLFKLDGAPLLILPYQSTTVHLPFKSPARPETPVAALSLLDLVPGVDFTANTSATGEGFDLTDNFAAVHVYPQGGFEAVVTITNRGPLYVPINVETGEAEPVNVPPGFLTLLKGRGKGLYIAEASAKVNLDTVYGRRPLQIVMPWQANVNTAADIANFFGNLYRSPFAVVDSVRFCANKSQTLMEAAIFLEPGALVFIQEDVTGIAGTFRIQAVHLEVHNGIVWCSWRLQNVDRQKFWLLGVTGRSELGLTTTLGF